jgi:hypothetical protein
VTAFETTVFETSADVQVTDDVISVLPSSTPPVRLTGDPHDPDAFGP